MIEYFATVADYNTAQFELFHALGYPAREFQFEQPAGEIVAGGNDAAELSARGGHGTAAGDPLTRP